MHLCPDCQSPLTLPAAPCPSCGWQLEIADGIPVYLSSEDRRADFSKAYIGNYEKIAGDDLKEPIMGVVYVDHMARRLVELMPGLSGLDVCDLGSGKGYMLKRLMEKAPKSITAVDIAQGYLKSIPKSDVITPVVANAENLPFKDAFDIVFSTDVMEHVINVGSLLYSVNRALRIGGTFVVRVPLKEDLIKYSPHVGCPYKFVHLRSFDKKLLEIYLEGAGFSVVKWSYDGFQTAATRGWVRKIKLLNTLYEKWISRRFDGYWDVTRIHPALGRLLMHPVEIVAVATKQRNL